MASVGGVSVDTENEVAGAIVDGEAIAGEEQTRFPDSELGFLLVDEASVDYNFTSLHGFLLGWDYLYFDFSRTNRSCREREMCIERLRKRRGHWGRERCVCLMSVGRERGAGFWLNERRDIYKVWDLELSLCL